MSEPISLRELRKKWTLNDGSPVDTHHEVLVALVEAVEAAKKLIDLGAFAFIGWEPTRTHKERLDAAFEDLDAALSPFTEEGA